MPEPATKPHLFLSDYPFESADRDRLAKALGADHLSLVEARKDALRTALAEHPDADVICTIFPPDDLLTIAPHLQWLALASAGADHVMNAGLVTSDGPTVTTANGVHAVPISEFVLSTMLLWARHWQQIFRLQQEHNWPSWSERNALQGFELDGATLGVVGLGAIGRRVAQLGHALNMHVLAVSRSASPGDTDPDTDELLPMDRIDDLLARADYVVLTVPSTSDTHHLINRERLLAMKRTAFLVNIARGAVVDEPALIEALRDGTIAGAGLDVVEQEPLPQDSLLWAMQNVILSPHLSGMSPRYSERLTDLMLDNIERYRRGETLRNVVDPQRGY